MAKQDEYARYTVRLPAEVYKRVQAHAEENERSINAEIISLLEVALWEADWSRIESGREPLREVTDVDRENIEFYRQTNERQKERDKKRSDRGAVPASEKVIPFFDEGPDMRELVDTLLSRLDRLEKKLDEK